MHIGTDHAVDHDDSYNELDYGTTATLQEQPITQPTLQEQTTLQELLPHNACAPQFGMSSRRVVLRGALCGVKS